MMALLTGMWSRIWGYAAAAGGVLAALGWAWLRGAASAREAARRAALDHDLDNRRTRDAVDRAVAARPDPAADLLRDWRRRD
ncbi:hypothetical protein [Plastoroseomonas arctica]|uniref:Uncharacterized protein n=1 Tax=Plastoroseomonas arctica TaxID=1509237 RepID=A0AAF1JWE7_9PROT|nr:hypothetical protein [Plastoroseomonas arctica]MBR0655336.1 hypothetical protein [Plastoroseomonas arctica]